MTDSAEVGPWERHLSAPFAGRKVICAFEVLAAMTGSMGKLRRWGAERPLLIADGVGTGPLPTDAVADVLVLDSPVGMTLTEQVRARMRPDEWLTAEATAAVERYDPQGEAVWWVSPPCHNTALLGRPVLGGRPPAQAALEDKLLIDRILSAVGADRGASHTVAATYEELAAATAELRADGATAVVWAGDARDGINGGSDYVRLIRTDAHARDAAEFFSGRCDKVKVTTFLDGVPCSVHALVLPDGVAVLRPLELASLRDDKRGMFAYAGMGTCWDPPPEDAEQMRVLARVVGEYLHEAHGYRGALSLDGVLTTHGFRVTELNPRFTGGLTRFARAAPGALLDLVQLNAVIGRDVARSAAQIEQSALDELERNRFADVMGLSTAVRPADTTQVMVHAAAGADRLEVTDDATTAIGAVSFGPSSTGGFVRLAVDDGAVGRGHRVAPLAIALLRLADETWGTGFGDLTMPPDVRTEPGQAH